MKLKINRWEFDVTNNDWVLDNGSCYQCMTLKHYSKQALRSNNYRVITIMSRKQFRSLVEYGLLVYDDELTKKYYSNSGWCRVYRFDVEGK